MLASPEQPENAHRPMLVTLFGMLTLISLEQPYNAYCPMLVTLLGILMLVTLLGMTILFRIEQS